MKLKELSKDKIPIVKIDKKLESFRGRVLFPEKFEQANKTLEKVGIPKLEKEHLEEI